MADNLENKIGGEDPSSLLKKEEDKKKEDQKTKEEDKDNKINPLAATPFVATTLSNPQEEAEDDDPLASFFAEEEASKKQEINPTPIEDDDDPLASFFAENEVPKDKEDDLDAFLKEETAPITKVVDEDDPLAEFFAENNVNTTDEDDDLDNFLNDEQTPLPLTEADANLPSFFDDPLSKKQGLDPRLMDDEDDRMPGVMGNVLGESHVKPTPILDYKYEKRKARLDITRNSDEDQRTVERFTKKEMEDRLIKDYKYMISKPYMMVQPLTIMAEYPYKKKKNDSDIIDGDKNVEYDDVIVLGKLLKWRSTEEFRSKPYKLGEIMYMRRGIYWAEGKEVEMEPHFAIVIHRSYKRIKGKRIRDLFAPLKQRLRSGKPYSIYKEFPIIIKRTGAYS